MKTRNIFYPVVALSLLWGCARHMEPPTNDGPIVTISASLDNPDTSKVAICQGDAKLSLSWETGDALRVVGSTSETYTINTGFTAHQASFTGTKVEGSSFTVLYPGTYESEEALLARSYLNQVQKGNGSTAHLEFNAIASNLTSYNNVSFSKSASNVKVNGAMKFVVKLPDGVTKLSSISLTANSNVFYTTNGTDGRTNTLTLLLEDCDVSKSSQILTAYMMTSWQTFTMMKTSTLTVRVMMEDKPCYFEDVITLNKTLKYLGGQCFVLDMSSRPMTHKISGSGTQSDPYLVCDPEDFRMVGDIAKSGQTTYYEVTEDIDMAGAAFTPMFTTESHTKNIDFDGNGHTIKNISVSAAECPSIFGELNGKVYDLTVDSPAINGTAGNCAVICGRLGSSTTTGSIKKVSVISPSVTSTLNGTDLGAGIIVGSAVDGSVENVSIKDGSLTVGGSSTVAAVGGVIGNSIIGVRNAIVEGISITNNLTNSGTTYDTATSTGGVVGKLSSNATIDYCSFLGGTLSATSGKENYMGGILGLTTSSANVSRCRCEFNLAARTEIGGVVGHLQSGSISRCYFKGNISGSERIGGIVGKIGERSSISDCFSEGNYTCNSQIMGGIAGEVLKYTVVSSCYSTAKLVGGRVLGGIIGRLANGGWTAKNTNHENKLNYCVAWNTSISATGTTSQGGSGAVVGYTGTKNTFLYCYRKYNFDFTATGVPSEVTAVVNQGQSTSEITTGIGGSYWYPYHANDVNKSNYPTVTPVVQYINTKISGAWDTNIWDLSSSYPALIGVGGSGGDIPEPTPGVNPGSDWTKKSIADGIDYYYFHKVDAITGKTQSVHVTAVDMNSGDWELKLFYNGSKIINSNVFAQTGAIASINGGYERPSIVMKQDGVMLYNIESDTIGDTGIKNWKNEGAVCFNEGSLSDISISAAGFGKDLAYQRKVYCNMSEQNIVSSAPVLISNFQPVGISFCSRYSGSEWGSSSNSEFPAYHQSGSYPRTAIGMTHDGYLLLVVCDGRFATNVAAGMGAAELTKFIAKYFNPKDLLNLDGGGSSTMCVKGCGDSSTHVVNYPWDNGTFDHAGERDVPTHFYIVPANKD